MSNQGLPVLGLIGAGKVGATLARLLSARGYRVGAVYSRTREPARALASKVGARPQETPAAVADLADLVLVAVPDDALDEVAEALAPAFVEGKGIVHTSGARDAGVFDRLAAAGAMTGGLHPAFPFADVTTAIAGLPGAAFAVEARDERMRGWLHGIVGALNGAVIAIAPGQKAIYHAALVFASNYTVTLYAVAQALLVRAGADLPTARFALDPLIAGMVENIRARGVPEALTGPIARGDRGTLAAHVDALAAADPPLCDLYVRLALHTLPLAAAQGIEPAPIEQLLRQALTRLQE